MHRGKDLKVAGKFSRQEQYFDTLDAVIGVLFSFQKVAIFKCAIQCNFIWRVDEEKLHIKINFILNFLYNY